MTSLANCPTCGRSVSTAAPTCPGCGHPFQPSKPRRSPLRTVTYLLIIAAGAYLAWRFWLPREVREGTERLVTAGHQVILDEQFGVSSKAAQARGFTLNRPLEIEVAVEVDGDGVDTYLVDEKEWDRFKAAKESVFGGGQFRHYPAFHSPKTQRKTMLGRLGSGSYYVIVENPTWGLLTKANFTVHLKVVANP